MTSKPCSPATCPEPAVLRAQRLDRTVFGTLVFALLTTVSGVGIVVPLLPVYAHELGAGGFATGLLFSSFSLSRTGLIPVFGALSDRHGRKPWIVAGMLAYSLVSLAFMAAGSVAALIVIRFFQGIASAMMMPVIQAYVGDITPRGREGVTMGISNMAMFLGLSLGPLTGGVIRDHAGLGVAFMAMGLLSLSGLGLCWRLLPPAGAERLVHCRHAPVPWLPLLADRLLAGLLLLKLGYAAGIGLIWSFLPLLAATEFSASASAIGMLVTLGVGVSGALHPPMGMLADRWRKPRLALAGGLAAAAALQGYASADGFGALAACSVLFGIGGGTAMPAVMALAVITGQRLRAMGAVMALMTLAHSLGMLIGAVLGGLTMDLLALRSAFTMGAALLLASAAGFALAARRAPAAHA